MGKNPEFSGSGHVVRKTIGQECGSLSTAPDPGGSKTDRPKEQKTCPTAAVGGRPGPTPPRQTMYRQCFGNGTGGADPRSGPR
jgi:hypothetical protein